LTNGYKLSIQLVPQQLWFKNLRKLMGQYEWGKLRKKTIAERGLVCETCGFIAPLSKNIFCHEKWAYETSTASWIAKLIGIKLTCWNCHSIEHWNRTEMLVSKGSLRAETLELLVNHFMNVNKSTREDFEAHKDDAVEIYSKRSSYFDWQIDWGPFSKWVAENYDGDPYEGAPSLY
jgi:hypothetical protein